MITIKNIQKLCLAIGLLSSSLIFAGNGNDSAIKEKNNTLATVLPQTTPPTPAIVNQTCSSAELQNTGTIPSGEMWYWQTTKYGTDTSYPATSNYIANGSGTYRLRPLHLGTNTWGAGSNVIVALDPNAGSTWYLDADGDGLGDPNHSIFQCLQPFGYVNNSNDLCPDVAGNSNDGGCAAEDPDNQNYIYTITARVATTDIDTLKGTTNGIENVTYFDGLGRSKQSVAIRAGGVLTDKNALLYDWTLGNTGSTGFFNQQGTSAENTIVNGTTPFGNTDLLWECKDDNNGGGSGWITDDIAIDPTKAYRYTTWVKINDKDDGRVYHGPYGVNNLDGTANSNPYFYADDLPASDTWYLLVGIIHPHNHTGGDTGLSGVYDAQGNKLIDATEFKWDGTSTTGSFRNYVFHMNNASTRLYFWSPLVQQINGDELPLSEVVSTSSIFVAQGSTSDIVTHTEYDPYGRQLKEYLPVAVFSNGGRYRTGDMTLVTQTYYKNKHANDFVNSVITDVNAYSEKILENSPLGRVFEQTAPGETWKKGANTITGKGYSDGHSIRFEYNTNTATEVRLFEVSLSFANNTYTPTLVGGSTYYPVGELSKTVTKDENWTTSDGLNHTTEEFKDKNGQVILKRTYANVDLNSDGDTSDVGESEVAHDTYYIYDDYGNLTYVLPPKVNTSDGISTGELTELSYQYKYDDRNRMVEKKIPGKGWEYIVYDKLDRPIMTQDANQRVTHKWLFTKYDVLGRVVYTGEWEDGDQFTRVQMVGEVAGNPLFETRVTTALSLSHTDVFYSNNAFPGVSNSEAELFTINYYDTYTNLPGGFTPPTSVYGQAITDNTKGLATLSKVRVLATTYWITTITYYDVKGRPVYVFNDNPYLGTTDIVESKLDDFTGKVLETKTTHKKTGKTDIVTIDRFEYDHMDRLIGQTQRVNDQTSERLVRNIYDDLGQLQSKLVGNGTQKGYADVTNQISIVDNEISRSSGSGWDAGLVTIGSFAHDGYIEYQIPSIAGHVSVGLTSVNTDAGFATTMDYAIYHAHDQLIIYDDGQNKGAFGSFAAEDIFRIERKNNLILFKKNEEILYTTTSNGMVLMGDISILTAFKVIKDFIVVDNVKGLQKVDYAYNVRGWLKNINNDSDNDNDLFNFNLKYNDPINGTALFNGNISQSSWNTSNTDSSTKTYTYSYDALNRITSGIDNTGNYNLTSVSYDKNGNILNLQRQGNINFQATAFGVMDDLTYTYDANSNRLNKVEDAGHWRYGFKDNTAYTGPVDYTYDANGNMLTDLNKNIASNIQYNHLNLPTNVSVDGYPITYVYDATGVKLRKVVNDQGNISTTDYAANHIYKNGDLQSFNHAEGYVEPNGLGGYDVVYQYTDIWNNVRLSYSDANLDGTITQTEIRQERNYYPFGLQHKGYNFAIVGRKHNKETYQDQEFTEDLGLNVHEWKYRFSDPATGRFWQIDPLSEDYVYNSTYAFQENKMGMGIELEGLELTRADLRMTRRDKQLMKGEITKKEYISEGNAEAAGAIAGVAALSGGMAISSFGWRAVGTFIGNEIKDEALSQATGGASDVLDVTKQGTKLLKKGVKALARKANNISISSFDEFGDFMSVSVKNGNNSEYLGSITSSEFGTVMELDIEVPEAMRGKGILTDVIQSGVDKLNPHTIRGTWKANNRGSVSTNYSAYMKNLKTMSPTQAALNTPTGRAAQKAGYTKAKMNKSPDGVISFDFTQ